MATEDSRGEAPASQEPLDAPNSSTSIIAGSSHHEYELVPTTETSTTGNHDTAVPDDGSDLPKVSEGVADRQDAGLLTRSRFHWSVLVPLDVLLALSPIFFFVIAGICLSLQGHEKSVYGENIKAITLVAPSIFPILYAAVLGKTLRRIGLYKAERSARIGTIERLVGCQSVFTAFERQIALRRFDLLGITILLAWLLSPIGGQTSLRMLSTHRPMEDFNSTVRYLSIAGSHQYSLLNGRHDSAWPLWAPLYMTALQNSRQYWSSPMDLYGNVRVPDIRQLGPSTIDSPDYDWYDFSVVKDVNYTSMLGLTIAGLPGTGNYTFRLQSLYWVVECGDWNTTDLEAKEFGQRPGFNLTLDWNGPPFDHIGFLFQTKQITKQSIGPNSEYANNTGFLHTTYCNASAFLVESEVTCEGRSCIVGSMRRLQRGPEGIYSLYMPLTPMDWMDLILKIMPGADMGYTGGTTTQTSGLAEQWIFDPDLKQFEWVLSSRSRWELEQRWVNLAALTPVEFSRRLQIAMNTFWDASVGSAIRMANFTLAQIDAMDPEYRLNWNETELKGVRYKNEQYTCNTTFAIITMGLSLALCVAAVVSLVLGMVIKAPDILGFVSTSARDNPYVIEHVSSRFDGLQTARALQDVRMRLGDVNNMGDVGHVAFTTIKQGSGKLSRDRLYD